MMSIVAKRDAIKKIMDSVFASGTKLLCSDIIKCDEHDGIIYMAVVLDPSCDQLFRFDRNADGTYSVKEYN